MFNASHDVSTNGEENDFFMRVDSQMRKKTRSLRGSLAKKRSAVPATRARRVRFAFVLCNSWSARNSGTVPRGQLQPDCNGTPCTDLIRLITIISYSPDLDEIVLFFLFFIPSAQGKRPPAQLVACTPAANVCRGNSRVACGAKISFHENGNNNTTITAQNGNA